MLGFLLGVAAGKAGVLVGLGRGVSWEARRCCVWRVCSGLTGWLGLFRVLEGGGES